MSASREKKNRQDLASQGIKDPKVIREAEELAADAFGAAHAFLMVGGTTSSVQTMVLSVCKRGDKIILPRNVHRSVINALVLCGAIPVYVNPEVNHHLGISLGMKREQVAKAIAEHPDAVAVLVNNPTYYGICSDLKAIVKEEDLRFLSESAAADACAPGNPKEATVDDIEKLYRSLL